MTYTSATAAATDAYRLFLKAPNASGSPARASGDDENNGFAVHSLAAGRPAVGGIRRALVVPVEKVRNDRHWDRIAAALMIVNSWRFAGWCVGWFFCVSPSGIEETERKKNLGIEGVILSI